MKQITNDSFRKSNLCGHSNNLIWIEESNFIENVNKSYFNVISYNLKTDTKTIIGTISPRILNIHSDNNGNLVWITINYIEGSNYAEHYFEIYYYFKTNDPSDAIDTDSDEMVNIFDYDDDNDGYNDTLEISEGSEPLDPLSVPLDNDKDFIPDSIDEDDDNDGVPDDEDNHPLDKDNGKPKSTKQEDYTPMIISAVIIIVILIIVGFIKKVRKKQ